MIEVPRPGKGWDRWASGACVLALAAGFAFLPASPASAAGWDVWPRDVRYCASTHAGHGTWSGFGVAIDMNAPNDYRMPLYAPTNGWVNVTTTSGSWGNSIHWVNADETEKLHLAHLDRIARTGVVEAGDLIGYVGSTGRSDSPHLHASAWRGEPAPLVLSDSAIEPSGCYASRGAGPSFAPRTTHKVAASLRVRRSWTRGSWEVRLRCTDDWSGCGRTGYRVDGGDAHTYSGPFDIASEGFHNVAYRSRDGSGHLERRRNAYLKIDHTRPNVSIRSPFIDPTSAEVEFRAKASDPPGGDPETRSGIYGVKFIVCPSSGGECRTYGGHLEDGLWRARQVLVPGEYRVKARAEDVAYNWRKSERQSVTVLAPAS